MTRPSFVTFYHDHYLPEHRRPANVVMHVAGTIGALGFAVVTVTSLLPWLMLLFPVVHAVPGLVGHRLFERNAVVGDIRVLRTDFPAWWFIAANHRLTFEVVRAALKRR
jgi:hypothetical protein